MSRTHKTKLGSKLSNLKSFLKKALDTPPSTPNTNLQITPNTNLLGDILTLNLKDYHTLLTLLNASLTGTTNDDELLLENLIQLLSKLPADLERNQLTDALLTKLWTSLNHPPVLSVGNAFRYRSADGSGNNINYPLLGAANTPYARTCPAKRIQPLNLPDPSDIFDSLMARQDKSFKPHPQGFSSMFFYLATIIIHDLFQTSSEDSTINLTSSYADLSPLYGRNQEEQLAVRLGRDGLLKQDCFSSRRILEFPPGCAVFLILFNRFHNYVVGELARINEGDRFTERGFMDDEKRYDEELFQTGRLIVCGLYGNIILNDYVKTILALNRVESEWNLDPRRDGGRETFLSRPAPWGVGNQISVEFNLIYRWHGTISLRDEEWTEKRFKEMLGGKEVGEATIGEVLKGIGKFEMGLDDDPLKRRFGDLKRDPVSKRFDDGKLVEILRESIEDPAGGFGSRTVPKVLKSVEVLGIMQARKWGVAGLNEFRLFMGLNRHERFEDINPDEEVVRELKRLYGEDGVDDVELYPGLMVEKTKEAMNPGSGLCVGYTVSRAILSDAVALIRGDRLFTGDYTPGHLTNWGFNEVGSNKNVSRGHVMYKLILNAFSGGSSWFEENSVYAHFPFVLPEENKKIFEGLGIAERYSWRRPGEGLQEKGGKVIV
ncbi:heme peroxidase [Podospora fimiseda]|uniref:Heme peroxidase n=1 Tax=Podospora fimiseda TaxID=252190 RepID=A0AAN6YNR6_9PEZI|nr:heme peroxidase [Podospora fimiseda]